MVDTVLVTGGTGFIAGWCIVELLNRGYRVRATVRDLSKESHVRAAVAKGGVSTTNLTCVVADLTRDDKWDAALAGCRYVLHVASPLGGGTVSDLESFIAPARDGTLRVLRAAVKASVERIVMTSAAAAARPPLSSERVSDETVWADPADPQFDSYRISKILAERAAWDFMQSAPGTTRLTTILPGAVFGPVLSTGNLGSVRIVRSLLDGRPPATPRLGFWIVDVRDLAKLHVDAMISHAAADQRFIAAGDFMWMEEMAATLRAQLGAQGAKAPRRRLPNFIVRLLLPFSANLRTLAPLLGKRFPLSTAKARSVLGFTPRPAVETLVDCSRSLLSVT